jgi:hypothetical protein
VLAPFLVEVGQFHHVPQVGLEVMAVSRQSVVKRRRRAVVLPSLGEVGNFGERVKHETKERVLLFANDHVEFFCLLRPGVEAMCLSGTNGLVLREADLLAMHLEVICKELSTGITCTCRIRNRVNFRSESSPGTDLCRLGPEGCKLVAKCRCPKIRGSGGNVLQLAKPVF